MSDADLLVEQGTSYLVQLRYEDALAAFDKALIVDPANATGLLNKARTLRASKDYVEAQHFLTQAREKLPQDVDLANELGFLNMERLRYHDAVVVFDEALALDPKNAVALQYKARSLRGSNDYAEAQRFLTEALKKLPQNADLLIEQGTLYLVELRYEEALAAFDKALVIDPTNATGLLNKAKTLRASKNYAEAHRFLTQARENLPQDVDLANELGFLNMDRLRYDEAVVAFDDALALDPKNAVALQYKTRSLRGSKNYVEAQRVLAEARNELPENVDLLNEQGALYLDQLSYDKAISAFDEALALDPKNVAALQSKAKTLRASKNYVEAQRFLTAALKQLPQNAELLIEQGALYLVELQYDDALAAFDKALVINPTNAAALLNKARTLRASKNYVAAQHFLAQAREKLPQDVDLANELGFLNMERLRYDEAIVAFDEALALDPKNAVALQYKARSLRASEDYVAAQHFLTEARKTLPQNADLLVEQGTLYLVELRYEEALAALDKALVIDPRNATGLLNKAKTLRASKNYAEAQRFLTEAREKLPRDVDLVNEFGFLNMERLRYNEAIVAFDEALALDPKNAVTLQYKVRSIVATRDYAEAENVLREARKKLPQDVALLTEEGYVYLAQRRYDEAIATFDEASKIDKSLIDIYLSWGYALDKQNRLGEALEQYDKAKAIDKLDWRPDHNIAAAYWSKGAYSQGRAKWNQALKTYESQLEKKREARDAVFFYYFAGVLTEIFGDLRRAREMYELGLKLDPSNPSNSLGLSNLYLEQRETNAPGLKVDAGLKALSEYMRAERTIKFRFRPDAEIDWTKDPDTLRQLAELQIAMRDLDKAESNLKLAQELDPDSAAVIADFGVLSSARGDYANARGFFDRAKARSPFDLSIRTNLGEAYLKSNEFGSAESEFKDILSLSEEHTEAWIGLGEVYTMMADAGESDLYADAVEYFSRGISLAISGMGKRTLRNKLAATYYSRGYARVKAAENTVGLADETQLRKALEDFENSYSNDSANQKAVRARTKLKQRLDRFTPRRVGEVFSSAIVTIFAFIVFASVQYYYFLSQSQAKASNLPARISEPSYVALTLGAIVLMITGLYLPRILKLKFGSIELEKSTVDQITSPISLGIHK